MLTEEAVVAAAADILAQRLGGKPELTEPINLGGPSEASVYRVRVAPNPFFDDRTLIIKQLPPSAGDGGDPAIIREIVAYQFTNTLPSEDRPCPAMLAYDLDKRIVITSDMGDLDDFATLWLASDEESRNKMARRLGRDLGTLHRATAGKEENFNVLMHRMLKRTGSDPMDLALRDRILVESIEQGLKLCSELDYEVLPEVEEIATIAAKRMAGGAHRAFSPFDLSPDNILCGQTYTFLDFEWAGFRDATFDLGCVAAGFPQFMAGVALNDEQVELFLDAWRWEVYDIWPIVEDNADLRNRIVTAMVGWALLNVTLLRTAGLRGLLSGREVTDVLENQPSIDSEFLTDARKDLLETFDALRRMAALGTDKRFPAVVEFSEEIIAVITRLEAHRG